jgi:hypothetical protein
MVLKVRGVVNKIEGGFTVCYLFTGLLLRKRGYNVPSRNDLYNLGNLKQ